MDYSKMPMNALCKHGIEINLICDKCRVEVAEEWPEVASKDGGYALREEFCIHGVLLHTVCVQCEADRRERSVRAGTLHKPDKRKGWINLYGSAFVYHIAAASHVYATREIADRDKDKLGQRIACIEIEWTE